MKLTSDGDGFMTAHGTKEEAGGKKKITENEATLNLRQTGLRGAETRTNKK